MRKTYIVFTILTYLFVSLIPLNVNAQIQDSENTSATEETSTEEVILSEVKNEEETIVIEEETNEETVVEATAVEESNIIIEDTVNKAVNMETQPMQSTARAVTYPATISSIFPDANFAKEVADQLTIDLGTAVTVNTSVTKTQLNKITQLSAPTSNIVNISGIEELTMLTRVNFAGNKIVNINNVDWTKMVNLEILDLTQNQIATLGPTSFNGMTKLRVLYLGTNKIVDLGQVNWTQLTSLATLGLYFNNISDISNVPWDQIPSLNDLRIFNNHISDISSIPCDKIKVDAKNQTITLPQIAYNKPILFNNPIVSYTGIAAPIKTMSNNGTYDDAAKVITWDVLNGTTPLTFTWEDTDATVGGTTKTLIFSGTATMPVEVKYNLVFNNDDGSLIEEGLKSAGDTITAPANPGKVGYEFAGWTPTLATTMPANDVTYTATFTPSTNTAYKVEYYQEQLDGSYLAVETDNLTGTTDATVNAVTKDILGFTYDDTNAGNVLTGTVAANGSLVLKVYYTRNTYTITFKDHDGREIAKITGLYGATYNAPANPTRLLHIFSHWLETARTVGQRAIHATIPNYNVTYVATYVPQPTVVPVVSKYDDGGPFTTDACGTITDRWGNVMYKAPACTYKVPNTGVK